MTSRTIFAIATLAALPAMAQQQPAPQVAKASPIVATINGETITQEKLDLLYNRLGAKGRAQYEKTGGKAAFLENYLRKRLVVQEALKSGFDKRPEVAVDIDAAREAALFDRYVRDVISAPILTDAELKKYYDEHPSEFTTDEQVKVRHIIITPRETGRNAKTKQAAMEQIQSIAASLRAQNTFPKGTDKATTDRLILANFEAAAKQFSEDGAAESGGDLGWVGRGTLDPAFEEAAFLLRKGIMSGIVETKFGYHLILIEDKKSAGIQSFEEAKPSIREYLMTQHVAEVVESVARLTNELRAASKINVYPENIR